MSTTATELAAVRSEVLVPADPARAFDVFTAGFDRWWPRTHRIGAAEMERAVLEPGVGGRWYERGVDGSECAWGAVLAWEPGARIVLSWAIDGNWQVDTDPEHAATVTVTFEPAALADGRAGTRVVLVHDGFERVLEGGTLRTAVAGEGGWQDLLGLYDKEVASRA